MGDYYWSQLSVPKRFIKGVIAERVCAETGLTKKELRKYLAEEPNGIFVWEDDEARSGQFTELEDLFKNVSRNHSLTQTTNYGSSTWRDKLWFCPFSS